MARRRSNIPPNTATGRPRVTGGFSFGSAQPRQQQQDAPKSHAIPTDNAVAEMRQVYRTAIGSLAQQYKALLGAAEDVIEQGFWTAAIERLNSE